MSIDHKDIPNSHLHEPKNIVTASDKTVYVANGSGSGVWRKINEADIDYTDKTKNKFGWNDVADSLYTLASPKAIAASTRTQLTNNALATQTNTERLGTIWDTSTNQFNINDLNASYLVRIAMKVKAAAAAGTPYTVKLEYQSANGPTVILAHDIAIKGGGYENAITYTDSLYFGSFINNFGLSLYVTPDTNITLYDVGFVINRIYKEV